MTDVDFEPDPLNLPWTADSEATPPEYNRYIYGGDGDCVLIAPPHAMHNQDHVARLAAAAPRLLQALQEAVNMYGKPGGPYNHDFKGTWIENAKQAIAEAMTNPA